MQTLLLLTILSIVVSATLMTLYVYTNREEDIAATKAMREVMFPSDLTFFARINVQSIPQLDTEGRIWNPINSNVQLNLAGANINTYSADITIRYNLEDMPKVMHFGSYQNTNCYLQVRYNNQDFRSGFDTYSHWHDVFSNLSTYYHDYDALTPRLYYTHMQVSYDAEEVTFLFNMLSNTGEFEYQYSVPRNDESQISIYYQDYFNLVTSNNIEYTHEYMASLCRDYNQSITLRLLVPTVDISITEDIYILNVYNAYELGLGYMRMAKPITGITIPNQYIREIHFNSLAEPGHYNVDVACYIPIPYLHYNTIISMAVTVTNQVVKASYVPYAIVKRLKEFRLRPFDVRNAGYFEVAGTFGVNPSINNTTGVVTYTAAGTGEFGITVTAYNNESKTKSYTSQIVLKSEATIDQSVYYPFDLSVFQANVTCQYGRSASRVPESPTGADANYFQVGSLDNIDNIGLTITDSGTLTFKSKLNPGSFGVSISYHGDEVTEVVPTQLTTVYPIIEETLTFHTGVTVSHKISTNPSVPFDGPIIYESLPPGLYVDGLYIVGTPLYVSGYQDYVVDSDIMTGKTRIRVEYPFTNQPVIDKPVDPVEEPKPPANTDDKPIYKHEGVPIFMILSVTFAVLAVLLVVFTAWPIK